MTLMTLLLLFSACEKSRPPAARHGVLDLTGHDFQKKGIITLDGEWTFYWKKLLTPDDLKRNHCPTGFFSMPSCWNGMMIEGREQKGDGYGTFTLTVKMNSSALPLACKVPEMASAYRLWVNGRLCAQNGQVAEEASSALPQFLPVVLSVTPRNDSLSIVMQVSNFNDHDGGMWHSIKLGLHQQIQRLNITDFAVNFFVLGVITIMGIYHLSLFILRRDQYASLLLGLFCFIIALRTLLMGNRMIIFFYPHINWELAVRLEHITFYACPPVFTMFIQQLFPEKISTVFVRFLQIISLILITIAAAIPVRLSTYLQYPYNYLIVVSALYLLIVLINAARDKLDGADTILAGYLILCLAAFNDIFFDLKIIHTGFLFPFGFFIFIFLQSFTLAKRFARAFNRSESLTDKLNAVSTVQERLLKEYEDSRFKNLQKRMYPHFLFNALHTIQSLMIKNPEKAETAIIALSDMYHFLLNKSFNSLISFEDEWKFTKNYLEFKQLEYPDSLSWEMTKTEQLDSVKIPPLTIQPLVENSLKHGVAGYDNGCVNISADYDGGTVTIKVTDNGKGLDEGEIFSGTLGNIRDRLKYSFPGSLLYIKNRTGSGVEINISFSPEVS